MLKKAFANLLVRKALIFTGVLTITLAAMGNTIANQYGEEDTGFLRKMSPMAEMEVQPLSATPQAAALASGGSVWDMATPISAFNSSDQYNYDPPESAATTPPVQPRQAPPQDRQAEAVEAAGAVEDAGDFVFSPHIPLSGELQEYTYRQCQENGVDYELVLAIMWRESRFQVEAVNVNRNGTRDSGIMQINDINKGWLQKELGITDLMDPQQNITAGTTMLGRFVEKYGEHNALMAYQYGEQGMKRKLSQGVTTNNQIQLVYTKKADFQAILNEAKQETDR